MTQQRPAERAGQGIRVQWDRGTRAGQAPPPPPPQLRLEGVEMDRSDGDEPCLLGPVGQVPAGRIFTNRSVARQQAATFREVDS